MKRYRSGPSGLGCASFRGDFHGINAITFHDVGTPQLRDLTHASATVGSKPRTPTIRRISFAVHFNGQRSTQDHLYLIFGERLGFASTDPLRHLHPPAGERIARDQLFTDGPSEHRAGGANPYGRNRPGGPVSIYEAVGPGLHLLRQQGRRTGIRKIGLQSPKNRPPSIDCRGGRLYCLNPAFKQHPGGEVRVCTFRVARKLFGPFVRPVIATGASSEQPDGREEIARQVIKEHGFRRSVQNDPLGCQELTGLGLIGHDRAHPLPHVAVTLPKLKRVAVKHAARHGRPVEFRVHIELVVLPNVGRPFVRCHSGGKPPVPLSRQCAGVLWGERPTFASAFRTDVGNPCFDLARPFAMFCAREWERYRSCIQALFGALAVEFGVLIAHVERDDLAGNEPALGRRCELGGNSGHELLQKRFVADFVARGMGNSNCTSNILMIKGPDWLIGRSHTLRTRAVRASSPPAL